MSEVRVRLTYTTATITTVAVAAVLAITLIAASPAQAICLPNGAPGGGPDADRICGTDGADTLLGQGGDDQLIGLGGNDTLDGGDGADKLEGGSGNDILIGGPSSPIVQFGDYFQGGSGNDQLRARDGFPDPLNKSRCGSGADSLDMDLLDAAFVTVLLGTPLLSLGCEHIKVGAVKEGPNVVISRRSVDVGGKGRAAVQLRCPASLTTPCAGTLRIAGSKKSAGAPKAYSIDPGQTAKVSARLSGRDRRKLSRRDEITASVTSVEQGEFGDKTTVQTLTLIAQG